MSPRQSLHVLVDELPDLEVPAALRYLEFLTQRPQESLGAFLASVPTSDEPLSAEDIAAIEEGLEEAARGDLLDHEEVKRLAREAE